VRFDKVSGFFRVGRAFGCDPEHLGADAVSFTGHMPVSSL